MSRAAGLEREKWQHALRRIRSSQGLDTLGALNQQVESRRKFMDGMAQQREEAMQLQRQATRSLQHEPSMYSAASLERRYALRHEPRVVEELRLWWLAAQTLGPDARGLSPSEYQLILLLVYKAMIDEFSLAEATQAVHEDWLNDARGSALLSASGFMDCLFELADVWTSTTDAEEYSEFLHRLLLNVTFVDEQGTRRFKLQESVAAGSGQPNSLEEQLERGLSAQERPPGLASSHSEPPYPMLLRPPSPQERPPLPRLATLQPRISSPMAQIQRDPAVSPSSPHPASTRRGLSSPHTEVCNPAADPPAPQRSPPWRHVPRCPADVPPPRHYRRRSAKRGGARRHKRSGRSRPPVRLPRRARTRCAPYARCRRRACRRSGRAPSGRLRHFAGPSPMEGSRSSRTARAPRG